MVVMIKNSLTFEKEDDLFGHLLFEKMIATV